MSSSHFSYSYLLYSSYSSYSPLPSPLPSSLGLGLLPGRDLLPPPPGPGLGPGPGLAEVAGAGVVGWPSHEARSGLAWEHRLQLKGRAAGPAVQRRQVKGAAVREYVSNV